MLMQILVKGMTQLFPKLCQVKRLCISYYPCTEYSVPALLHYVMPVPEFGGSKESRRAPAFEGCLVCGRWWRGLLR